MFEKIFNLWCPSSCRPPIRVQSLFISGLFDIFFNIFWIFWNRETQQLLVFLLLRVTCFAVYWILGFKSNPIQINPNHLPIFSDFDFKKLTWGNQIKSKSNQFIWGFWFDLKNKIQYTVVLFWEIWIKKNSFIEMGVILKIL